MKHEGVKYMPLTCSESFEINNNQGKSAYNGKLIFSGRATGAHLPPSFAELKNCCSINGLMYIAGTINSAARSPAHVRGSCTFQVGLNREVQRRGNPRQGKELIFKNNG